MPSHPLTSLCHLPRGFRTLAVTLTVVVLTVGGVPRAGAQDPRREQERVRQDKADLASQLDALNADEAQVSQALADLEANVAGQQALLAEAQNAADAARAEAARAHAAEQDARQRADVIRSQLKATAIEVYVKGGFASMRAAVEAVADPTEDPLLEVTRRTLAEARANAADLLIDQLRAIEQERAAERRAFEQATAEAEARATEINGRLSQLQTAQAQQQSFANDVHRRIEANLAEAAALEALDAQLAREIAAREAALSRRVPASSGGGGGGSSGGGFNSSSVALATTHGITVSVEIVDELDRMLNAAEADGIVLGGSGFRDNSRQVELRRQNCGPTDYDIYDRPPGECSPPTARPGQSMHERGLAVDFSYGGRAIASRDNPGFIWLDGHAAAYGFYNLPSEPWHWSTTGN